MANEEFSWKLINFPDDLTPEQATLLEKVKFNLSVICIELEEVFLDGFDVFLISSFPQTPKNIQLQFPVIDFMLEKKISEAYKIIQSFASEAITKICLKEIRFKIKNQSSDKNDSAVPSHNLPFGVSLGESIEPRWSFDDIELDPTTKHDIQYLLSVIMNKDLIFNKWGLKAIQPRPSILVNFHGPAGTGKTISAHAIAKQLKKTIIELSYAQVESKYVGDGPKNLRAVFKKAVENSAVLFFDEADSLLGQRIRNISSGADQAINSMRSQMLLEMDRFEGVAIFATNLRTNYDFSFNNRLLHVKFPMPDLETRTRIWKKLLVNELPDKDKVDVENVSMITEGMSGRDIRDIIILSATSLAIGDQQSFSESVLRSVNIIKRRYDENNISTNNH